VPERTKIAEPQCDGVLLSQVVHFSKSVSSTTEKIDIWQAARQMIEEHREEACVEVLKLAAKMLERREYASYEVLGLIGRQLWWPSDPVSN
jgi:hypothetical protein